jgi:hypothetical protein
MNKAEQREVSNLVRWGKANLIDSGHVARVLSALIRASLTKKSRVALLQVADELGVKGHPEFII